MLTTGLLELTILGYKFSISFILVYDDYKFVSGTELQSLGLTHMIGSSMLRAYMHGYFMDIRLYHKVN